MSFTNLSKQAQMLIRSTKKGKRHCKSTEYFLRRKDMSDLEAPFSRFYAASKNRLAVCGRVLATTSEADWHKHRLEGI